MANDDMIIQLRCVRRESGSAEEVAEFSAKEYFDLDPGEPADCDSPPKHLELATYFDTDPSSLRWIKVFIFKRSTGELRTLEERYWGAEAGCRMSVLTDFTSAGPVDTETVVQITDPKSRHIHILRFGPSGETNPGGLRVHSVIWTDDDGEHAESMIAEAPPIF